MKVTFKMTSAIAEAIKSFTGAREGDVLTPPAGLQYVNYSQKVTVSGDFLTFEGERNALWGDELAPIMRAAVGGSPLRYETSDRRLEWYETLDDYMNKRASLGEALEYFRQGHCMPNTLLNLLGVSELLQNWPSRAYAQYTAKELNLARELLAIQKMG